MQRDSRLGTGGAWRFCGALEDDSSVNNLTAPAYAYSILCCATNGMKTRPFYASIGYSRGRCLPKTTPKALCSAESPRIRILSPDRSSIMTYSTLWMRRNRCSIGYTMARVYTPETFAQVTAHTFVYSAPESTDSSVRYAAYATRLRTILLSAHRYVAYTSDIGESFRPIAHPWLIKSAYGISWAYLIGDVSHEGYKAYLRNQRVMYPHTPGTTALNASDATQEKSVSVGKVPAIEDFRSVMAQRAVFQGLASMGLPAFTIHSIVRYSGRAMKNAKTPRIRTWGPIGVSFTAY